MVGSGEDQAVVTVVDHGEHAVEIDIERLALGADDEAMHRGERGEVDEVE